MQTPNKKGFTLVELMIVVAIIGILAAIAVPNFIAMQHKSKRAEVPGNLAGIKTAELAYDAAFDGFMNAAAAPTSTVGKTPVAWPSAPAGFSTIGWAPDGQVRGQYSVALNGTTDFTVTGICDVDGNGTVASYQNSKSTNAALLTSGDVY